MDGPMDGKEFVVPSIPIGKIRQGGGGGTTSPLTTKGDLWGYSTTDARLPVGTNGQILVADSTAALGVKWANASGGGDMLAATYDPANIAEQLVGLTASQTLTNKTLTAPAINSGTVGTKLSPTSDDGAPLGDTTHNFSDLFLASGAVINFNAGDVTITHAANNLLFAGASTGYTFDAKIYPTTDDGAPLGDTTHNFSDLFLATGAVINFANGNAAITHSSGIITVSTGDLRVTTAGTNAASAVTVGGTQALTNKTLTAPAINSGTIGTSLVPTSDDGAALGDTTHNFSDLFLASGAVINYANSNVVITHTSGILTMGTGDFITQ